MQILTDAAGIDCCCGEPIEDQACCFPDGTCQDLPPSQCLSMGGTPQGIGTTCAGVECPGPPEGCPTDCSLCSVTHAQFGLRIVQGQPGGCGISAGFCSFTAFLEQTQPCQWTLLNASPPCAAVQAPVGCPPQDREFGIGDAVTLRCIEQDEQLIWELQGNFQCLCNPIVPDCGFSCDIVWRRPDEGTGCPPLGQYQFHSIFGGPGSLILQGQSAVVFG